MLARILVCNCHCRCDCCYSGCAGHPFHHPLLSCHCRSTFSHKRVVTVLLALAISSLSQGHAEVVQLQLSEQPDAAAKEFRAFAKTYFADFRELKGGRMQRLDPQVSSP